MGFLIAFALAVIAGLMSTLHKRDPGSAATAEYKARYGGDRWEKTIRRWIERGFVHDGGMQLWDEAWVKNNYADSLPKSTALPPNTVYAWKNSTMSWIVPAYWLQKANVSLRGEFSPRLMLVYNQLAIAFPAVALGYLCFLMALQLGQRLGQALTIGAGCQLLFQTYPLSLLSYWEVQPISILLGFAVAFLCHESRRTSHESFGTAGWKSTTLRTVLATMTLLAEPITGGFFLLTYLVVRTVLDDRTPTPRDWMVVLVVPAVLVVLYLLWQQAMVRAHYDSVVFVGSPIAFRVGLDGDTTYYKDQVDILLRRLPWLQTHWIAPLLDWSYLNYLGFIATAALIAYYRDTAALQPPVRVLLASYGLYVPLAIVFSQLVFIHPYYWNLGLLVPLTIALFCLVPAFLNLGNRLKGLPVLGTTLLAIFYAAYHARVFATVFPTR
ncbi:MAG: hypothetical protein EHM59_11195 [Betaproteobacteria bacterium]|nr:MAG: hypothetical protein EHM59_11195 [Betaproteobacteria bacterium]